MCIICRMRNGCHCWLFLVAVDIIRKKLSQVTESPFYVYCNGSLHRTKGFVYSTIWKTSIIWDPFSCFQRKQLFKMNMIHQNTDNISHAPILAWPGMTSSPMSHASQNDITQHFFLNSFLVLSLDTKRFHSKHLWNIFMMKQIYAILPLFPQMSRSGRQCSWKYFSGYVFIPILSNTIALDVSWCKCFVCLHFKFYSHFGIHNMTIMCC